MFFCGLAQFCHTSMIGEAFLDHGKGFGQEHIPVAQTIQTLAATFKQTAQQDGLTRWQVFLKQVQGNPQATHANPHLMAAFDIKILPHADLVADDHAQPLGNHGTKSGFSRHFRAELYGRRTIGAGADAKIKISPT